jgi:hypothetical protein
MPDKESGPRQGHAGRGIRPFQASRRWVCGSFVAMNYMSDALHLCSKTLQTTEASIVSGFGWGLTKRIENHGLARFKANVQRVCRSSTSYRDIADIQPI